MRMHGVIRSDAKIQWIYCRYFNNIRFSLKNIQSSMCAVIRVHLKAPPTGTFMGTVHSAGFFISWFEP